MIIMILFAYMFYLINILKKYVENFKEIWTLALRQGFNATLVGEIDEKRPYGPLYFSSHELIYAFSGHLFISLSI